MGIPMTAMGTAIPTAAAIMDMAIPIAASPIRIRDTGPIRLIAMDLRTHTAARTTRGACIDRAPIMADGTSTPDASTMAARASNTAEALALARRSHSPASACAASDGAGRARDRLTLESRAGARVLILLRRAETLVPVERALQD